MNTNFTDVINGITDGTKDLSISALTCAGTATLNGNVTLGNASADDLTINASLASSLPVKTTNSYDLGSTSLALRSMYVASSDSAAFAQRLIAPTIGSNYSLTMPGHTAIMPASDGADKDILQTDGSGTWSFVGGPGITSKTTTYTATTADKVITATTSSGWTLTLYAASGNAGRTLRIIKTSSDTNALTIDGNGSETINGKTTIPLTYQYEYIDIVCDGSNWFIQNTNLFIGVYGFVNSGSQTSTGSWQAFPAYSSSSIDPLGNFTTSTGTYVTPFAGFYSIQAAAQLSFNATGTSIGVYVSVGGTAYGTQLRTQDTNSGGITPSVRTSFTAYIAAGVSILAYAYQDSGGNLGYVATNHQTLLSIAMIK